MSVKKVADMLALAYEGLETAREANDAKLKELSLTLIAKAMQEEYACDFFSGIQLALGEIEENPFGNDPDIDNNDEGVMDPESGEPDENSPAGSPSSVGITDDQGSHEDEKNKPHEEGSMLIAIAASNFRRLAHARTSR